MRKRLFILVACAALTMCADTESPRSIWTNKTATAANGGMWWFANVTNWQHQTSGSSATFDGFAFPKSGECAMIGDNARQDLYVYLKDGDVVNTLIYLGISYGFVGGVNTLEVRKGAFLRVMGTKNSNWEYLKLSDDIGSEGRLFVTGGAVEANTTYVGGGKKNSSTNYSNGTGWLKITDGGVFTNTSSFNMSETSTSRLDIVSGTLRSGSYGSFSAGGNSNTADWRTPIYMSNAVFAVRNMTFNGTTDTLIEDSFVENRPQDWSANSCNPVFQGGTAQTNTFTLRNSVYIGLHPEWHDRSPEFGRYWDRWEKIRFGSKGYTEFVQDNSVVTNGGIWFWPSQNTGNVYPLKPSRYTVKGGELYVYSGQNYGDSLLGYGSGVAAHGICAFTNAPNSGTITFVDAPKVSFPRVNTNVLVSGCGQDANSGTSLRTFAVTTYRPHFEFVLTKKGHRPAEIRNQTGVLGMYSFVPQGGLQIMQTTRFALLRHSTASSVMTTVDEPQFRAPNSALWTTGPFADTPREWGVTLKDSARIALGANLGAGVAEGFVQLPKMNPATLRRAVLRLKLQAGAKTISEVAAGIASAGYAVTQEEVDVLAIDLKASGLLAKGSDNRVLLDFNEPQDAVGVRDNVKIANALILRADAEIVMPGFALLVR